MNPGSGPNSGPAPGWRRLLRLPLLTRRTVARAVDDEIAFHLAMREESLQRKGYEPVAAHATARSRFGDPARVRDECITIDQQFARELRMREWIESVAADARHALRAMRKSPSFSVVATLTLALGIGATTAVFSIVSAVLLEPLPYPHPEQLVQVLQSYPEKGLDEWALSQANFAIDHERQRSFAAFAAYNNRLATVTGLERPAQVNITSATADYFKVFSIAPLLGRTFVPAEGALQGNRVAVLSYGYWQRSFGGDSAVLRKSISVNGIERQIVGVMPPGFNGVRTPTDIWVPLQVDPTAKWGWNLQGIARLRPEVTAARAESELTSLLWAMGREDPNLVSRNDPPPAGAKLKSIVTPLHDAIVGNVQRPLMILQIAVLLVLLIAVTNVATLLSSRTAARRRELALRCALGAASGRVARQLITESLVLALTGAALGVVVAEFAVRALPHLPTSMLPRLGEVHVDLRVLAFALVVSIGAGLTFGLVPALQSRSRNPNQDLAGGGKGTTDGFPRRLNTSLVVAQLALSVLLLIGASLTLESMQRLLHFNLGFDPDGVTNLNLPLSPQRYAANRIAPFTNVLLTRVRALPGVSAAAVSWGPPFSWSGSDGYRVEGHESAAASGDEPQTVANAVSPGYFATMRIPLLRGRDFSAADRDSSVSVVIVDEALARRYWPNGDALGHRILMTGDTAWRTIVGLAGSIRDGDPAQSPQPHTYFPYAQNPESVVNLQVRTHGDAHAALAGVLRTVAELDPSIPLDRVAPLNEVLRSTVDNRRLTEMLLSAFAAIALLLAAVGIYGTTSLLVGARAREFGVRLAIGAEPRNLLTSVLADGFAMAIAGAAIGVSAALVVNRWISSLLYQVSPRGPVTFIAVPSLLVVVALVACLAPARRAARGDPLVVLRGD